MTLFSTFDSEDLKMFLSYLRCSKIRNCDLNRNDSQERVAWYNNFLTVKSRAIDADSDFWLDAVLIGQCFKNWLAPTVLKLSKLFWLIKLSMQKTRTLYESTILSTAASWVDNPSSFTNSSKVIIRSNVDKYDIKQMRNAKQLTDN